LTKRWWKKNPQKRLEHAESLRSLYCALKVSARNRCLKVFSFNDFVKVRKGNCHYCGGQLPRFNGGLDRKKNSKGYIRGNCVPCCTRCNSMKGPYLTYEEMVLIWKRRNKHK
jgi:hypothetical protein